MICPHCNTPNPPEAVYCISCNALLPSPGEKKKQRRIAVLKAIATALLIPLYYYASMMAVAVVWVLRFTASVPAGISKEAYTEMYTEAFNNASAYINILAAAIALLVIVLFYGLKRRPVTEWTNVRSAPPTKFFSAFLCGLTLQLPIGMILALIPIKESVVENHNELMNACTSPMWVQLLYAVILAPIIEELFFRGIVHDRLSRVMPVPVAATISAAVFGLIHGEILSIAVAFACGLFLAYLYSRFNTVLVPIAFHMGFNLFAYTAVYITDPVLTIAAVFASLALLIGGAYLLFRKADTEEKS